MGGPPRARFFCSYIYTTLGDIVYYGAYSAYISDGSIALVMAERSMSAVAGWGYMSTRNC